MPVLPAIAVGFDASARPVPDTTTARMSRARIDASAADNSRGSGPGAGASPCSQRAGITRPCRAIAPAMRAIFSGESTTSPCPYPAYASDRRNSAGVEGRAMSIWNSDAASSSGFGPIRSASCAKYALHDTIRPRCRSTAPCGVVSIGSSRTGRGDPGT